METMNSTQKMRGTKRSTRAFLISLAVLILISVLNWGVVSCWGSVKVERINLLGDEGMTYSALMYVPENATNATPAPALIMFHGANGNGRNHEAWSLEYSRRGYVCIAIDWNGAGDSESLTKGDHWDRYLSVADVFMKYLVELPFVDRDQIITSGHSMGCTPAYAMAVRYNTAAAMPCSGLGNILMREEGPYNGNLFVSFGSCDVDSIEGGLETMAKVAAVNGIDNLELDTVYGSFEEGNARYFTMIQDQIHEGVFVNGDTIEAILNFSQQAVKAPNPLPADDQIWYIKDFTGLFGMIAFVAFILNLALFLMDQVPALGAIRQPMPRNIGLRGIGLGISIAAAILFPILCMKTGTFGLAKLLGSNNFSAFAMGISNKSLCLVVGTSLFGLVMLFVFWFTDGKKQNATLYEMGLAREGSAKMDLSLIGKALLLAVLVVAVGWIYLAIQGAFLGTDFYCQFFGYKPVAVHKFTHYIPYMIVYMLCFLVAAVGINVERRLPSTGSEAKDTVIAMVFNSVLGAFSVTLIVIIQRELQIATGGGFMGQAMSDWTIDVTRLWGMPVGMVLANSGNTYLYRKTGSIWLGAFTMGMICALGSVLYGTMLYV